MTQASLEARIGGLLMIGFDGLDLRTADVAFLAGAAGAILFRHNIAAREQVQALVNELQTAAEIAGAPPLLIAIDEEGGPVSRLGALGAPLPAAMALGAAGDIQLSAQVYRALGEELAAFGFTLDLAPVADLSVEPRNTVIGLRSFGSDADMVALHVSAAVRGLHDAGIACAVKHFPGHGATAIDSHVALPVVSDDPETLRTRALVPFRAAIEAGADMVMSAHIALPNLDATGRPATLSRAVLTDVLRGELGFTGVICTDDIEMRAIAGDYPGGSAAPLAIEAGADLIIIGHSLDVARDAHEQLRRALDDGRLSPARIEASLARVGALRKKYARKPELRSARTSPELRSGTTSNSSGVTNYTALAREAAQRAITIIRDGASARRPASLPLRLQAEARVLVVDFNPDESARASTARVKSALAKSLAASGWHVSEQTHALEPAGREYKQLLLAAGPADAFVTINRRAIVHPLQAQAVADLAIFGKPIVAVAAQEPYDAMVLPADVAVIASFGDSDVALEAAAEVILGRASASGRVPVRLAEPTDQPAGAA